MSPKSDETLLEKIDEIDKYPTKAAAWNYRISYKGVLAMGYFHLAAIYGLYLSITSAKSATILFSLGVTAGAHRLWSHRSYKATLPLQIILMLFQSMCLQYTVINWVRQHRLHHKYSDTDADPHNASRGFFFSHLGWTLVEEHDEVTKRITQIDVSDATSNPVLRFQKEYAYPVIGMMCFVLPTVIPVIFWGETINVAWHVNMLRYALTLHGTFLINSAAHIYGNRPYDTNISPTQNTLVSLAICGEGFHNYHHTFPWDYRAAELGNTLLNLSTMFINLCAWFGWAYDLKTVTDDMIKARARKTGDGTHMTTYMEVNK
ncbi:acyl-CoA Delta(11) desaturase-like isoform X2 [Epargyreus clarus]|uniref:acyl-CoA Delta(11) desaturase-like isoform X2 n=1 Tax=Epargyreus clarus TaxID=520877 RepID=UPI003C2AF5F4